MPIRRDERARSLVSLPDRQGQGQTPADEQLAGEISFHLEEQGGAGKCFSAQRDQLRIQLGPRSLQRAQLRAMRPGICEKLRLRRQVDRGSGQRGGEGDVGTRREADERRQDRHRFQRGQVGGDAFAPEAPGFDLGEPEIDLRGRPFLYLHLHRLVELIDDRFTAAGRARLGRGYQPPHVDGTNAGAAFAPRHQLASRSRVDRPSHDLPPRPPLPRHLDGLFQPGDVLEALLSARRPVLSPWADDRRYEGIAGEDQARADVACRDEVRFCARASDQRTVQLAEA